jgi:hypothetical protein
MTELVLYNAEKNQIQLWSESTKEDRWKPTDNRVVWTFLWAAVLLYGWEVVGEL